MSNELITKEEKQLSTIVEFFNNRGIVDFFQENTTYSREVICMRAMEFVSKIKSQDFENQTKRDYKSLASCSAGSKEQAFLKILSLDLPTDYRQFYYLYNRNGTMAFEVSYKGMLLLAQRAGFDLHTDLVFEGDNFQLKQSSTGDSYELTRQNVFGSGNIVGAFVVAESEGLSTRVYTYTFNELEMSRKKSKAPNSPAWQDFKLDMYKKCALRKALNIILSKANITLAKELLEDDDVIEVKSEKTADIDIDVPKVAQLEGEDKMDTFHRLKEQFGVKIDEADM